MEIAEILESWRTPDGKRFRVRTQDGQVFELAYSFETDAWAIVQK